jgi:hypothetical protein
MAFYSLIDDQEESIELPWFNEYEQSVSEDLNGQEHYVLFVKSTPKGFIFTTNEFNAWVWRKTILGQNLSETLHQATSSEGYPQMIVKVNTKVKSHFQIGLIDDVHCAYVWSGENNTFTLHPQKNLPLELPPQNEHESKGEGPLRNVQSAASARRKASAITSKVESSPPTLNGPS